jgi:SNF family Na+-dependent transporter
MASQPTSAAQEWGSKLGVILAVAGSAVGLGNFLRFPGNVAQNGGGAFMIPYFVALFLLGIPIGWAEWTMGRYGGRKGFHSAPAIYGLWAKGPIGRYMGVLGVLIPLAVYFYYVLIESWCLWYFWSYATQGGIGIDLATPIPEQVAASKAAFSALTGQSANGANLAGTILPFFLITTVLNVWFVHRGLSGGIEILCNYAMPSMAICGVLVLVRVLTLGTPDPSLPDQSVINGLGYMWNPDFTALANPKTWLAAAGQIFFSLSVGFGVIINYASYMKKDDDVVLSGLTASATNEFFEVALGGLITVTAAVAFLGVEVTSANAGSTFALGFNTVPVVFAHMPGGAVIGGIWFFMLFLAAITSSLSMLQPAKAFFQETLGLSTVGATAAVTSFALVGNFFVLYNSKDLLALDTIDFWVGTVGIFMLATAQVLFFGWFGDFDAAWESAHVGSQMRIPAAYRFILRYVTPTYLIGIFGLFCYNNLPDYVRAVIGTAEKPGDPTIQKTWAFIAVVVAALVAFTALGERRWRAAGLDLDNRLPPQD